MKLILIIFSIGFLNSLYAWEDPTGGKAFFPWAWEDQLKPTLIKSVDKTGLKIIASGTVSSLIVHEYDKKIYYYNEKHPLPISSKDEDRLSFLGNGLFGVGIAFTQLALDQDNGLRHLRALFFSTISHAGIAVLVRRDRPNNKKDFLPYPSAFPSGHTTAAFVTAGALAYSYGWMAGVPAYTVASAIAIGRVRGARHWTSDVVAGAFLGTFWARASFAIEDEKDKTSMWYPSPIEDGVMLSWLKEF